MSELTANKCPWLAEQMATLSASHAAGRISHALMIHESRGAGGTWLATWIAQLVLCTSADTKPCGVCIACKQTAEGIHPDLTLVQPIEESKQIRIEQVRDLTTELTLTSHHGGYKVGILTPADTLNRFAANALLKTLEEPTPRTVLILVAEQPSRLPATIMSRCQRIRIRAPARNQSIEWLRRMKGEETSTNDWNAVLDVIGEAPLEAVGLDAGAVAKVNREVQDTLAEASTGRGDPVAVAERWSRSDLPLRLQCTENWLTERIRRRVGVGTYSAEMRPGTHLPGSDSVMNIRTAFGALDRVRELKSLLDAPINRSLALESLLRDLRN